jgi:hypothetical protein
MNVDWINEPSRRGILKRGASVDRQALLAELAYLAA